MAPHRLIGEILCDLGFLTWDELVEGRKAQKAKPGVLIGKHLQELGYLTAAQLELGLRKQREESQRTL
jgi:hypothetical protein